MKDENAKKTKIVKITYSVLIIIFCIVIVVIGMMFFYLKNKFDNVQSVKLETSKLGIQKNVAQQLTGYKNIAVFGVDSRSDDYGVGNRSDCIIIVSINNDTGDIKLISVYRDTYVDIEGYGLDKINHAYSFGEAPLAINTLNKNLDLNIDEFITVNFDAVVEAVDLIGGIELEITADEVKYINAYIQGTSKVTGKQTEKITKPGIYTVDGVQAVAYSRIRYTEGGDYKRTERMRTVIEAMFNKLKGMDIAELNKFADAILPHIYTNIDFKDIIPAIPFISKYKVTQSIGWPYETRGKTMDRWYGIPITLESNVIKLHKDAFGKENYNPSDFVKTTSEKIINKTGYNLNMITEESSN